MKYGVMVYILVLIVVILIVGIVIPAVKMHTMLDCRTSGEAYNPSEFGVESSIVNLKSADGLSIVAYEVDVDTPRGVIICLAGIHSKTVTNWYGHARLFADNGYASILLDLRSHGQSEGESIYAGTREWMDVDAVVSYIKSNSKYTGVPIVVMGLSMGAATALVSIGRNSNIDGVIALSAFSSWEYNFNRNVEQKVPMWVAKMLEPFVSVVTYMRFGRMMKISPINQIANIGSRPALLIHSIGDRLVPFANFEQLTTVAPQVQTWVVEGDNHCIIDDFLRPQTDSLYCDKIIKFLTTNF